jgi:hypothetical protein
MGSLWDDEEWGRVPESTGEYARLEQLNNHLLLIFPLGYIDHSPTRFSVPGKKSDVIVCDIIDLDDIDESGGRGKLYRNTWWRGAQLIMSLRPRVGSKVLGRLGKGVAKNGMNAPWVITDMVPDPECLNRAKAWGHAHPDFVLSPFQPPSPVPAGQPAPQYGGQPAQPQYTTPPSNGYGQQQPAYQPQYGQPEQYPGYPPQAPPPPPAQPYYDPYQSYPSAGPPPPPPPQPVPVYPQQGSQGQPYPPQAQAPRFPVIPTPPASQDDLQMLEAMRQRRQAQEATGYSDTPPF